MTSPSPRPSVPDGPTPADLARWEELAEGATAGPWSAADEHGNWPGATPAWCVSRMAAASPETYLYDVAYTTGTNEETNAEFIAAARTAVPVLAAAYRAAVAEVERLQTNDVIADALGHLWVDAPARRAEIETLCKEHGLMISVDE